MKTGVLERLPTGVESVRGFVDIIWSAIHSTDANSLRDDMDNLIGLLKVSNGFPDNDVRDLAILIFVIEKRISEIEQD